MEREGGGYDALQSERRERAAPLGVDLVAQSLRRTHIDDAERKRRARLSRSVGHPLMMQFQHRELQQHGLATALDCQHNNRLRWAQRRRRFRWSGGECHTPLTGFG